MAAPTDTTATLPGLDPVLEGADALFPATVTIVTGKGGVGKTTTAASLALAGVASGRRTLLLEVEGRQGFSRLFGTAAWDYQEREFRPGLWGAALDPADAVYEYLELFYGIKRVQWVMERSNALDFVTTAAPGLRDLLLVGKIYEIEALRPKNGRRAYDLIVVDAPPTGRIVPFLQAPEGVTEIVRVGPIRRQAAQIREMLTDPRRSQAIVVTLLEEMPVREASEGLAALQAAGVAVGPVVANRITPPRLDDGDVARLQQLGADGLRTVAADAGATVSGRTAALAVELADAHIGRLALQRELYDRLTDEVGTPVLGLPRLTAPAAEELDLDLLADVLLHQVGEPADRALAELDVATLAAVRGVDAPHAEAPA